MREYYIRYNNAMVIGKFMPFHKGHVSLINLARVNSSRTYVFVLGNDNESISLRLREQWVHKYYKDCEDVLVLAHKYDDTKLNSSSESDRKSSEEWAEELRRYVSNFGIDVIFGSEPYVQYMAEYLGIKYVIYDEERKNVHISATDIRNDIITNWDYLTPYVKQYFARHICICGSECSGKTTVCKALEDKYEYVTMIPEIGRCLVGNSNTCTRKNLDDILRIHEQLLKAVLFDPPTPIVIWDTDNITTLSYYKYLFEEKPFVTDIPLARDYFFFDVLKDYKKGVTRLDEKQALELRNNHLYMYDKFNIHPRFIAENEDRIEIVEEYVKEKMNYIKWEISGEIKID